MALKTREDYLAALRKLRPNIYKFGELIEDVSTHQATKRTVESHARCFDAANEQVADAININVIETAPPSSEPADVDPPTVACDNPDVTTGSVIEWYDFGQNGDPESLVIHEFAHHWQSSTVAGPNRSR